MVDEWQVYMQLPQENFDPDLNVMAWWRDRQLLFPTLSKMARQFLSCPATSAGVERIFSGVGHTRSDLRTSLKASSFKHAMKVKSVGKA